MPPTTQDRDFEEPSVPADPAHAADVALLRSRDEEEAFARQHSMPTRLLGWMLIAGFVFQVLVSFASDRVDLGGLIFLIAGIHVKRGSQAALRFVVFLATLSLVGIITLIWEIVHLRPLQIGRSWCYADDLKFWTLGVSPQMYLLAESILGIMALRTRRLPFWTKTVRIWACICGGVILLGWGLAIRDWHRNRVVEREMAAEIAATRAHVSASPLSVISSSGIPATQAFFSSYPQIERVEWHGTSNSSMQIYQRVPALPQQPGSTHDHEMWLRDGSGNWGKLEMTLIIPDKPH